MTQEDYSKVPPPHLLKKFSEQAREDSSKRGHFGYCKTFAKLCIDWAFKEAAMDDLRAASAEMSGVELNSKSSPNDCQIRSSDITPPPELVQELCDRAFLHGADGVSRGEIEVWLIQKAFRAGADQELDACCEWVSAVDGKYGPRLRLARRPKPLSLKEQALLVIDTAVADDRLSADVANIVRRALEALDD